VPRKVVADPIVQAEVGFEQIRVHYAALQVVLLKTGELEAAEGLRDWWEDYFGGDDGTED